MIIGSAVSVVVFNVSVVVLLMPLHDCCDCCVVAHADASVAIVVSDSCDSVALVGSCGAGKRALEDVVLLDQCADLNC